MKKLTHKQAVELLKTVRWKTKTCGQKGCWCRMIVPIEAIKYFHKNIEYELDIVGSGSISKEIATLIVGSGSISKEIATLIVKEHNENLANSVMMNFKSDTMENWN